MEKFGAERFRNELAALDYEAIIEENWVVFDYDVPAGSFAGKRVCMAILVPPDFPRTPPSGIDFTPRLRRESVGAEHPHRSHPVRYPKAAGVGEYWSRPFPNWAAQTKKTTGTYMAHVRRLWETT